MQSSRATFRLLTTVTLCVLFLCSLLVIVQANPGGSTSGNPNPDPDAPVQPDNCNGEITLVRSNQK